MHSDTGYRPIELPVSHLLQNLDQSVAFRATTLSTISWWPVHNCYPNVESDLPYSYGRSGNFRIPQLVSR